MTTSAGSPRRPFAGRVDVRQLGRWTYELVIYHPDRLWDGAGFVGQIVFGRRRAARAARRVLRDMEREQTWARERDRLVREEWRAAWASGPHVCDPVEPDGVTPGPCSLPGPHGTPDAASWCYVHSRWAALCEPQDLCGGLVGQ